MDVSIFSQIITRKLVIKAVHTGLFLLVSRGGKPKEIESAINTIPSPTLLSPQPAIEQASSESPSPSPTPIPDSQYAGLSQLSSEGKACIPCGNAHLSTAAGALSESLRFAREGGINHPEVITRITIAEDELNQFERIDGAPEKVARLPEKEKVLMRDMMAASRGLRHNIGDISDVETLEKVAAMARNKRIEYMGRTIKLKRR
ncbi:MAG TPA: hypothetical protein VMW00_06395 [Dehalococcoidales bacterium]|nr:hypothetical protein [Dehalococcoidales bacterium]